MPHGAPSPSLRGTRYCVGCPDHDEAALHARGDRLRAVPGVHGPAPRPRGSLAAAPVAGRPASHAPEGRPAGLHVFFLYGDRLGHPRREPPDSDPAPAGGLHPPAGRGDGHRAGALLGARPPADRVLFRLREFLEHRVDRRAGGFRVPGGGRLRLCPPLQALRGGRLLRHRLPDRQTLQRRAGRPEGRERRGAAENRPERCLRRGRTRLDPRRRGPEPGRGRAAGSSSVF